MVAVKSAHKIEYIGFSERTQNILLFELSIVNPIYLECHISKTPGVYSLSSPTLPPNRDFGLNPALRLCFRTSHPRTLLLPCVILFNLIWRRYTGMIKYSGAVP